MKPKTMILALLSFMPMGCGTLSDPAQPGGAETKHATIIGQVRNASSDNTGNNPPNNNGGTPATCPEVEVALNGAIVNIEFDDSCSFLIDDVSPSDLVTLKLSIASLGLTNTAELSTVVEDELIEILVEVSEDSLGITIVRRAAPAPKGELPEVICDNNVSIELAAGVYKQNLAVVGNQFLLVGKAGEVCTDSLWTTIEGDVTILGNNATFQNIKFVGKVNVSGNKATFINCCFDGALVTFGKSDGDGKGDGDDFGCGSGNDDGDGGDDDDDDDDDD